MTNIIKRNYTEALATVSACVAGRYKLVATKLDGRTRVIADWFENLILENGLHQAAIQASGYLTTCSVGTSSVEPNINHTALGLRIATTTDIFSIVGGAQPTPPYFGWVRKTFRFATGTAAGTLAEVGVGWSADSMFSRSLIKDSNGNPTTITILSDEILDVIYELRLYAPTNDTVGEVTGNGTTYTITARPYRVNHNLHWGYDTSYAYAQHRIGNRIILFESVYNSSLSVDPRTTLGTVLETVSATYVNPSNPANNMTVVNNTYNNDKRVSTTYNLSVTAGNVSGGIGYIQLITPGTGAYQFLVSPNIMKTSEHTLSLTFELQFDRYTP